MFKNLKKYVKILVFELFKIIIFCESQFFDFNFFKKNSTYFFDLFKRINKQFLNSQLKYAIVEVFSSHKKFEISHSFCYLNLATTLSKKTLPQRTLSHNYHKNKKHILKTAPGIEFRLELLPRRLALIEFVPFEPESRSFST